MKPTNELNRNVELEKLKSLYNIDFSKKVKDSKKFNSKLLMLYFGDKGVGKTTTFLLSPPTGKKVVLSFDGRTHIIKNALVDAGLIKDEDVTIFNILDDFIDSPEQAKETGFLAYEYLIYVLENEIKDKGYDFIIFDGLDYYNRVAEMRMRFIKKCPAFGPIDLNFWKLRTSYIMTTHRLAVKYAEKGVIYSANYDDFNEYSFKDKNDEIIEKRAPKYMDLVKKEIDYLVENEMVVLKNKEESLVRATIVSSKNDSFLRTGKVVNLSGHKSLFTEEDLKRSYPHLFSDKKEKEDNTSTDRLLKEIKSEKVDNDSLIGDLF
jgi:hypothetical protein